MKIYTGHGDLGRTSLIDGRVSKSNPHIDAIGTVDELNSYLGIIINLLNQEERYLSSAMYLQRIQDLLFRIGADLAIYNYNPEQDFLFKGLEWTKSLEQTIDELTESLEPLKNFILPGGNIIAAHLHYARTVCRRAERAVVVLAEQTSINGYIAPYLNRLSDFLFTLARTVNANTFTHEQEWFK